MTENESESWGDTMRNGGPGSLMLSCSVTRITVAQRNGPKVKKTNMFVSVASANQGSVSSVEIHSAGTQATALPEITSSLTKKQHTERSERPRRLKY